MEETISLKEVYNILKKRLILIIGCIVFTGLLVAGITYFLMTPKYEASSQFIVNHSETSSEYSVNDVRVNVELINTYNVIIKSVGILNQVVEELSLPYSAGALGERIQVNSEEGSQVVTVTVRDENPEAAVQIANTIVEIFQDEIPNIMNVDNVSIFTVAELSENPSPVEPVPILNLAIGLTVGAMIGIGLAFLLEYLDNTVETEEDIEKQLNMPLLGVVAETKNKDTRQSSKGIKSKIPKQGEYHGT